MTNRTSIKTARRFIFLISLLLGHALHNFAQTISVSPRDVNAYSQGATSVLLTFGGVANKQPAEATWCGALVPATPDLGFKCDPATIFGQLPARYDQSTRSAANTFTDIMSVTPQVARRAYLDAVKGNTSSFFYVRRFVSTGGPDEYVPVTIRLTGNGTGVPLSLTEVKLSWGAGKPVLFVKSNEKLPRFQAEITYTGTGRLKGRWELVKPGETPPDSRDLLTEATLPLEERGTQRKYTQLSRFNIYLPPTGSVILPGPEVWRVDESLNGMYLVLLRIEASDDKEGDTNLAAVGAAPLIVHGGAVAGFSLPTLRYYVGNGGTQLLAPAIGVLAQLAPEENAVLPTGQPVDFSWTALHDAATYKLEVEDLQGVPIISAIVTADPNAPDKNLIYRAPPWLEMRVNKLIGRWRVRPFDRSGKPLEPTDWRSFRFGSVTNSK